MIGRPNQSTRYTFCRKVRSSRNKQTLEFLGTHQAARHSRGYAQLDQQIDRMSRCSMRFISSELSE